LLAGKPGWAFCVLALISTTIATALPCGTGLARELAARFDEAVSSPERAWGAANEEPTGTPSIGATRAEQAPDQTTGAESGTQWIAEEKARLEALIESVKARETQSQAALSRSQNALRLAQQLQDSAAEPIAQAAVSKSTQALEKAEQTRLRLEGCLDVLGKRSDLATLHAQVKRTQEALARLNRSIALDQRQREEWESVTDHAVQDAWNRSTWLVFNAVPDLYGAQLDRQLKQTDSEIARATDLLAGETDPNRREQLHVAFRLLTQRRVEIKEAQSTVAHAGSECQKLADQMDWTKDDVAALRRMLDKGYDEIGDALARPEVQKALGSGGGLAAFPGYAKSIVDSAYDITGEYLSWKALTQSKANSDQYVKAVGALSDRMKKLVQRIQELEGKGAGDYQNRCGPVARLWNASRGASQEA
jgi:tetratricopeptide (TPR) repeat protein